MRIKDLFAKPIDRPINGVIKADQADSESVWQELDEYVVTKELDVHFRRFFGAYLDAIDSAADPNVIGKVGVWISGFFGAGKSHFLKILSYLLENRERRQRLVLQLEQLLKEASYCAVGQSPCSRTAARRPRPSLRP